MTIARSTGSEDWAEHPPLEIFFGRTKEMELIRRKLEMVARTNIAVLIQGESGTGKELCARLVHESSQGAGELVKVSCPAIPAGLLETELFGYEKGAFTGAQSTKRGRLEQAHNGTLLLDEVGSLDIAVQAKLLQVLQDGSFTRVGGHDIRNIQTRIVCVSNRDLREQVAEGSFRLDFLYRINAITLQMPPLRERIDDIPELVDFFLQHHSRLFRVDPAPLSRNIVRMMQRYNWPGNIRQLDNMVRSYVLIGNEDSLAADLMEQAGQPSQSIDVDVSQPLSLKVITKKATQDLERQIILKVLKANNWNRQKTARWLKISYRSLLYKLNEVSASGVAELGGHSRARSSAKQPADGSDRRPPDHVSLTP